jgi:pimeloyl-ACP methyl ester carboxylesterase
MVTKPQLKFAVGGSVALCYAAAYPERIGHLVLPSPGRSRWS